MLRFAEVAGNIKDSNDQPVIQGEKLVKAITERFGFDFDMLTSASSQQQSPEAIINELEAESKGTSIDPNDPNSPNFVPPAQRSGATNAVPTSGGRSAL